MISVSLAEKTITQNIKCFSVSLRPLDLCFGAVLQENIYADRDLPSFNKALMDGIAINFMDWSQGQRIFKIVGVQPAGKIIIKAVKKCCVEIMTGAVVAAAYDCVVPIEQIKIQNGMAIINPNIKLKKFQNVHLKGQDHKNKELLIPKGAVLTSPRIGILASVGKTFVKASSKMNIAIISTGDELIAINHKPKIYQSRLSNSHALKAAFNFNSLFSMQLFHLKDNKNQMLSKLRLLLKEFDCLILSGGVSMGKFDFVPQVLKELKVKVLFHKVAQKPGKPLWFGIYQNKPIFALPGNPVSTLVCAYRYVLPTLKSSLGIKDAQKYVYSPRIPSAHKNLTVFQPIKYNEATLKSEVLPMNNSGNFAALASSDGFIEIPPQNKRTNSQKKFKYYSWN